MKARDIVIGQTYLAKVSGRIVPVRVTGTFGYTVRGPGGSRAFRDGYEAVNTATGRALRLKSAARLREPAAAWTAEGGD